MIQRTNGTTQCQSAHCVFLPLAFYSPPSLCHLPTTKTWLGNRLRHCCHGLLRPRGALHQQTLLLMEKVVCPLSSGQAKQQNPLLSRSQIMHNNALPRSPSILISRRSLVGTLTWDPTLLVMLPPTLTMKMTSVLSPWMFLLCLYSLVVPVGLKKNNGARHYTLSSRSTLSLSSLLMDVLFSRMARDYLSIPGKSRVVSNFRHVHCLIDHGLQQRLRLLLSECFHKVDNSLILHVTDHQVIQSGLSPLPWCLDPPWPWSLNDSVTVLRHGARKRQRASSEWILCKYQPSLYYRHGVYL